MDPAADGWQRSEAGPFIATIGPMWRKGQQEGTLHGLLVDKRHGNHRTVAHGGVIMTLTEHALSVLAAEILGQGDAATLQLDVQFLSAGEQGDFLIASGTLLRRSSTLVFLRGEVRAGERLVAAANGIWKIAHPWGAAVEKQE